MLDIIFLLSTLSGYQARRAIDQKFNSYIPENGRDSELEALRQIFNYNDVEKQNDFHNVSDKSKSSNCHSFISDYLPSSDPKKRQNLRFKNYSKPEEIQSNRTEKEEHNELKNQSEQEQGDEPNDKREKEKQNESRDQTERIKQLETENERNEYNERNKGKKSFNQLQPSSQLKTDQYDAIKDKNEAEDHNADIDGNKETKNLPNQKIESVNDSKKTVKSKNLISNSSNESTYSQRNIISNKKPNSDENQIKKEQF